MKTEESKKNEHVEMDGHTSTGEARRAHEGSCEGHTAYGEVSRPNSLDLKVVTEACAAAIVKTARDNVTRDLLWQLPMFNGSPKEWPWFVSAYEESAPYFTELENRCRLRACLRGAAKETAYCMLIGAKTPDEAIEQLQRRFGHPGAVIQMELDRLYAHPTVEEDLWEIRAFAMQVSNVVAMIKALDQRFLHSPWTEREILDKFPYEIRYRYFHFVHKNKSDEPDLVKLDNYMRLLGDRLSILIGPKTGGEDRRNEPSVPPSGGEQSPGGQPTESENETEYKHTNPSIIVMEETNKLYALPKIADRKKEICDFELKAAISIIRIKTLNKKEYLYCNPEVVRAVVNKLPFRMRLHFCDYVAEKADEGDEMARLSRLNLVSLADFLLGVMHVAQMCGEDPEEEERQDARPRHQWRRRRGRNPASRGRAF